MLLAQIVTLCIAICLLAALDFFIFRRFKLRALNTVMIGLFFGYLLGSALSKVIGYVLPQAEMGAMLIGVYLGVMTTVRAADELAISIPFVRFSKTVQQTRELIIDPSVLADERFVDLASTGLLDRRLVLPRFVLQDLYSQAEYPDETTKKRAVRSLDVLKKLETLPNLQMRKSDTDYGEVRDPTLKLTRFARQTNSDILTASMALGTMEGVRLININDLSKALKPLMQTGEFLNILIQRYGKEEHQGVGYLEDGTMVVVNGGGDYLGEEVNTRVISVKRTAAGRIIFCNVDER